VSIGQTRELSLTPDDTTLELGRVSPIFSSFFGFLGLALNFFNAGSVGLWTHYRTYIGLLIPHVGTELK